MARHLRVSTLPINKLTVYNQVCHIHIGQAGVQLGNSAWEL